MGLGPLPRPSPRSVRHEGSGNLRCCGTLALCCCSRASSISVYLELGRRCAIAPEGSVNHPPSAIRPDQGKECSQNDAGRGNGARAFTPGLRYAEGNGRGLSTQQAFRTNLRDDHRDRGLSNAISKGRVAAASGWTFGHVEVRSAAAPIVSARPASRLPINTRGHRRDCPRLGVIFGAAGLVILWLEVFVR